MNQSKKPFPVACKRIRGFFFAKFCYNTYMKKNIGKQDRIVRFVLALACILLALSVAIEAVKIILLLLAIFCLYEVLVGWCAFYQLIGKNTCPVAKK